jgi:hypothetical protein
MRYREMERIDLEALAADVRRWKQENLEGTAEQAVEALELPHPADMVIVVRGILAAGERP